MQGRTVHLVGGGNSAGQAALLFAEYAESVTMLVRGRSLAASMSQYLIDQLSRQANVRVETDVEVTGVEGHDTLEVIEVASGPARRRERRPSDALFVLIGGEPVTAWLPPAVIRDQWGYVCTGRDVMDLLLERPPTDLAPGARSLPAGDQRARHPRRGRRPPRLHQARARPPWEREAWRSRSCTSTWASWRRRTKEPTRSGPHRRSSRSWQGQLLDRALNDPDHEPCHGIRADDRPECGAGHPARAELCGEITSPGTASSAARKSRGTGTASRGRRPDRSGASRRAGARPGSTSF